LEEGFGWCDLSIADGRRFSAADAYLVPASGRPNLNVVTDALVRRVTVEADGPPASTKASAPRGSVPGDGRLRARAVGPAHGEQPRRGRRAGP